MDAIERWRTFEERMRSLDLGWVVHYAAGHLAPSERPWPNAQVDGLIPADFAAFEKTIGYPMVGYSYYCRVGFSVLTPAWREKLATGVFWNGDEPDPGDPFGVMFAGIELSDVQGWAFRRGADGGIEVWSVDGNLEERVAGSFTEWLDRRLGQFESYGQDAEYAAEIAEGREAGERDPHRLIDYSAAHRRGAECNALCELATRR